MQLNNINNIINQCSSVGVANVLDCDIIESYFKLQLCYYVQFWTIMFSWERYEHPYYPRPNYWLNRTTCFFYGDSFGIK